METGSQRTDSTLESIIHAVSDISHFENASVAEHPGWCGDHFVLSDGSVFGPAPGSVHVVFRPDASLGQRRAISRAGIRRLP